MTGSSRKPISKPAPGSSMLAVPAVNDVAAPRPIKLFMLGLPLNNKTACCALTSSRDVCDIQHVPLPAIVARDTCECRQRTPLCIGSIQLLLERYRGVHTL